MRITTLQQLACTTALLIAHRAGALPGRKNTWQAARGRGVASFFCKGHYRVSDKKMAAKKNRNATFTATTAKILSIRICTK
jgi:hypothetical protein